MDSFRTICHNTKFNRITNVNGRKVIDTAYLTLKSTNGDSIKVVEGREYDVTITESNGHRYYVVNDHTLDHIGSVIHASVTLLDNTEEVIGKHDVRNFSSFFYTPEQLRDSKIDHILKIS